MRNYWSIYLPIAFLLFFIPEIAALATGHPENTLSDYLWRTFGVIRNQPIRDWSFRHFAFAGGFTLTAIWLIGHFGLRIWT
jgi:hypothetical protein